jgi:predicted dinucleotide-utilizing enzyme
MEGQNIAIIGLGRIGSAFLGEMLGKAGRGINLVCVSETMETPGKAQAVAAGIRLADIGEIVAMGDKVDVIFDLTGIADVRKTLRSQLAATGNNHTVIASETIARLIWSLISSSALPTIAGRKTGY